MSLLPSRGPETSTSQDGELQIVGVDEDVSAVFDALSSETARKILNAVYEEPATASEIADRLGMSIQKVSYHLDTLKQEELIAVAGTQYSEKGQEMQVYEPPEDPLVLFVGTQDRKRSLRSLAKRLIPVIGVLTAASAMIQFLFGTLPGLFGASQSAETGDVTSAGSVEATPTEDSNGIGAQSIETTPETTAQSTNDTAMGIETVTEAPDMGGASTEVMTAASSSGGFELEPGLAFFLGGLFVTGALAVMWLYTR
jgi:DNA-binding transcriptional ArsR family regulator